MCPSDAGRTLIRLSVSRAAVGRPGVTLAISLLAIGWLTFEATRLRFEPRIDLLSPADPLSIAENARRGVFGRDFRIIAALFKPREDGGVLTAASLEALEDLHNRLEAEPGIRRVCSLVNAPALGASEGTRPGETLWAGHDPGAAETLLKRLRASPLQELMLLAQRHSLTPLFIETDDGVEEADLVHRINGLAAEVEKRHPGGGDVLVVGPAVVETSLGEHVFQDLNTLVPFAVAAMLLVLLAAVRRAAFAAIAVVHAAALTGVTLGGMALSGVSVNLVSVLAPVLMIPIGIADLLHLFVRLESGIDALPSTGERVHALEAAYRSLQGAMVGTSATTAIGFLGFLLSPVAAVRQFGLTLSAGTAVALLLTLTLDAALLALLWRPRVGRPARPPMCGMRPERWILAMTRSSDVLRVRSRRGVIICSSLAVAGAVALTGLRTDDTWIGNFDADSPVARDALRFEGELLGTNVLAIVVESDPSVPDSVSGALDVVNNLPLTLMGVPGVRGALSLTVLARSLDPVETYASASWPVPTIERLGAYREEWERRGMPLPRAGMMADASLSRFQILAFILNDHYQALDRIVLTAGRLAEEIAGGRAQVRLGGDLASNMRMVRLAVNGQTYSLAALLALMAALAIGYTRSVRSGLMIVVPMALAILVSYLVVVALGIPYGVAVSMFPTLMIGQAVDFAIHVRAALGRNRNASRRRWAMDMAVVVRGILLNGAIWTAGFAVLAFSALPPNRYLGLLCSSVVALSTAVTLLLIPTAALVVERAVPGRARSWT